MSTNSNQSSPNSSPFLAELDRLGFFVMERRETFQKKNVALGVLTTFANPSTGQLLSFDDRTNAVILYRMVKEGNIQLNEPSRMFFRRPELIEEFFKDFDAVLADRKNPRLAVEK